MAPTTEPEVLTKSISELADVQPKLPVRFEYMHRKMRHYGMVSEVNSEIRLCLVIEIATVPYTSENPAARESLLQLLHSQLQLETGRFFMNSKQKLMYQTDGTMDGAVTGATIVATATQLTIKARPYIVAALEFATLPKPKLLN